MNFFTRTSDTWENYITSLWTVYRNIKKRWLYLQRRDLCSGKPLLGLTAITSLNLVTKVRDVILDNDGVISRFPQLFTGVTGGIQHQIVRQCNTLCPDNT